MHNYKYFSVIVFTVILQINFIKAQVKNNQLIDEQNIKANLEYLASDLVEGRETATRGEKLAALYITTELKKYGVKPFIGDTSYYQYYNLNIISINNDSKLIFENSDKTASVTFKFLDDFFPMRGALNGNIFEPKSVVFAGYGITAPEYNYDDYKNVNVKDKYVIVLDGEPSSNDSSFFEGEVQTKYSSSRTKFAQAQKLGAAGLFIVAGKEFEQRWNFIKRFFGRPQVQLAENQDSSENFIPLFIKSSVLENILQNQKFSYETILNKINANEPLSSFELTGSILANVSKNIESAKSANIIGYIEGTDPELKKEFVAIGAHYDHLGIIDGKVYNGADDDGSGTVTIMEAAKAIAASHNNKRSVLVVFHSGEEKGLLGSSYLTNNLNLIKENKIVTQINIDMVGRESPDTIYSIGSAKLSSELKDIVEKVNEKTDNFVLNYKFDDPNDPNRFYYRSDHYNYAKKGIPIVFFYDFMMKDYHKFTDVVDKINFNKIAKMADLVYNITETIANLDHRPVIDKPVE